MRPATRLNGGILEVSPRAVCAGTERQGSRGRVVYPGRRRGGQPTSRPDFNPASLGRRGGPSPRPGPASGRVTIAVIAHGGPGVRSGGASERPRRIITQGSGGPAAPSESTAPDMKNQDSAASSLRDSGPTRGPTRHCNGSGPVPGPATLGRRPQAPQRSLVRWQAGPWDARGAQHPRAQAAMTRSVALASAG
jgi:hypothetical protein